MAAVCDGAPAGTTGRSLSLEALRVSLENQQLPGTVQVRAHVSGIGWQDWTSGTAGTTGRSLRMEALQVRLTGEMAASYDVYYRAHVSGIGWMGWAKDGDPAGTVGMSRAVEAVQVKLVARGSVAPGSTSGAYRGSQEHLRALFPISLAHRLVLAKQLPLPLVQRRTAASRRSPFRSIISLLPVRCSIVRFRSSVVGAPGFLRALPPVYRVMS